jgi:hypothetical protein
VKAHERPGSEGSEFKIFRWVMQSSVRLAAFGALGRASMRMIYALGLADTALDPTRKWTKMHAPPKIPKKSFRAQWKSSLAEKK